MARASDTPFLVLAMLALGSWNTINGKFMYQLRCPTLPHGFHVFNKPFVQTLMMFCGEASLLLAYQLRRKKGYAVDTDAACALLTPHKAPPRYLFLVPACCDVLGTGLAAVAMMLITASQWQMMRGSVIVFSAVLAVVFLRRRLEAHHWCGICITVAGLLLIGGAVALDQQEAGGSAGALGIVFVVLAQLFAAAQITVEEYLLVGYQVSSLQVVGLEGMWGCGLMAVILPVMTRVPGDDHGVYESLPDTLHMLRGSAALRLLAFTYMVSIAFYNYVGMRVCRKLSGVTRCLVDCMRTAVVWLVELGLYYGVSDRYGHAWTPHSVLQLLGFGLLVAGTFMYNGYVRTPSFRPHLNPCLSRRSLQATWSPTVNRASAWGLWGMSPNAGAQRFDSPADLLTTWSPFVRRAVGWGWIPERPDAGPPAQPAFWSPRSKRAAAWDLSPASPGRAPDSPRRGAVSPSEGASPRSNIVDDLDEIG